MTTYRSEVIINTKEQIHKSVLTDCVSEVLYLNFIRVTKDNIDKEPPCCAISGKQGALKKAWLKQRFDDHLDDRFRLCQRHQKRAIFNSDTPSFTENGSRKNRNKFVIKKRALDFWNVNRKKNKNTAESFMKQWLPT